MLDSKIDFGLFFSYDCTMAAISNFIPIAICKAQGVRFVSVHILVTGATLRG